MPELGHHCLVAKDQGGVGREDQVRQTLHRRQQRNPRSGVFEQFLEALPLPIGRRLVGLTLTAHPRIDFVFNPIEVRRTHQDMRLRHLAVLKGDVVFCRRENSITISRTSDLSKPRPRHFVVGWALPTAAESGDE